MRRCDKGGSFFGFYTCLPSRVCPPDAVVDGRAAFRQAETIRGNFFNA
jgi:hypothetical protein